MRNINAIVSFTVGQLVSGFLAICAGITCIAVAVSWIVKAANKVKEPEKRQDERITDLERRLAKHDEFLDRDKERLEVIEEGNRVTQQALLALLAHSIDGNDIKALKDAKKALQDYLIKRR